TLSRPCVRHVQHRFAFSLAPALRSTASAAGRPALFGGFVATMAESDFSCPCIIGFGSSPSRCGPAGPAACGRTCALSGSGAFLFGRDVAFDPGGATASRVAIPHILPSTVPSVSASATFFLSWLNPPPHPITVYASHSPSPTTAQHSHPGGALLPYRGRSFTGRNASASPDPPERKVRSPLRQADSPPLTGNSAAQSRPPAFRAGVGAMGGGAVGRDRDRLAIWRLLATMSLLGQIPVPPCQRVVQGKRSSCRPAKLR